jgi:hypothetical protein
VHAHGRARAHTHTPVQAMRARAWGHRARLRGLAAQDWNELVRQLSCRLDFKGSELEKQFGMSLAAQ